VLKKITASDARIGMFIHEIGGSWLNNPFWKSSFLVSSERQLNKLQEFSLHDIWIDTNKGLDVELDTSVVTVEQEAQPVKQALQETAESPPEKVVKTVPLHEEIDRSRKVYAKAKKAVKHMFHEVRMGNALHTDETFALVDEITQSLSRNSNAFLGLSRLKEKDHHTYMHSVAVCGLMIAVGRQFDIEGEQLRNLGVAGLLHDAGLAKIPTRILNKPGHLSEEESNIIRTHPALGWDLLEAANDTNEMVLDVCLHHHERMDGDGYPKNLPGESLSLYTKICTVCDVYDTITSDRYYQKSYAPTEAIRRMTAWQPGQFDLNVFHALVKTVGIYPVGTLLKLKSGRLAAVTDQTSKSLLTPIVKVFYSINLNAPIFPKLVDLSITPDEIISVESPKKWSVNVKTITGI